MDIDLNKEDPKEKAQHIVVDIKRAMPLPSDPVLPRLRFPVTLPSRRVYTMIISIYIDVIMMVTSSNALIGHYTGIITRRPA